MSFLSGNKLWDGIKQNTGNAMDRVLGPSYDYTSGVKRPDELGVSDEGSIGQVFTNANAVKSYTQQLITGPLLGNTTFVETGGMCRAPDGSVVPRWSYVDNRMSLKDAVQVLPGNLPRALGGSADVFQGIVPGMMGDIAMMNPLKPISGLTMDAVPPCVPLTCPVTDINGNNPKNETKYVTPELELSTQKCTRAAEKFESSQFDTPEFMAKPFKLVKPTDLTHYVYWGIAVAVLFGVVSSKL